MHFGQNLENLISICGELWRRQAQNGVKIIYVQIDLEGQGQSPRK